MRLITIQHKNVLKDLKDNGVYKASIDRVSEVLVEPYKFMQKHFGWSSTPIFLSPVGYYVEMGGAKLDNDHIAIELEIPEDLVKIQRYYDWSDFIYFTESPWEFADACNVEQFNSVPEWGKTIMNISVDRSCKDPLQVTVKELRREWVTSVSKRLDILDRLHNDSGGANRLKELRYYM